MNTVNNENIDYNKYNENSGGMSTREFGPPLWKYLFTSIMGRYPFEVDFSNPEHILIANTFSRMLIDLKDTLPCVYCRESYKVFIKELPINNFLVGRIELMKWLYLIKDRVNKKLITQENKCFEDEKKILKAMYYTGEFGRDQAIADQMYRQRVSELKKKTFLTVPSPPFEQILDYYESFRAVCSEKSKSCVKKV